MLVGLNLKSVVVKVTLVDKFAGAAGAAIWAGGGVLPLGCRLDRPTMIGLSATAVTTTLSPATSKCGW